MMAEALPTWSGSYIGNMNYLGISGKPALSAFGTDIQLQVSSFIYKDPLGNILTNFELVTADAEKTEAPEEIYFEKSGGTPWVVIDQSGTTFDLSPDTAKITWGGAFVIASGNPNSVSYKIVPSCSQCRESIMLGIKGPTIVTTGNKQICSGESISLSVSGASGYTWMPGGSNNNPLIVSPTSTTMYSVTGISAGGCRSTTTVLVTVDNSPTLIVSPVNICNGQKAILTASGANTYTWSTGATGASLSVTPATTTTYTVSGTVTSGCLGTGSGVVTVNTIPIVSLGNDTLICGALNKTLNADNPGATYLWNTGATKQTIDVTQSGIYSVQVTSNGCTGSDEIAISTGGSAITRTGQICKGDSLLLTSSQNGTYNWSTGASTKSIYITTEGTYWVATQSGTCVYSDTIHVNKLLGIPATWNLPNVFTPNNDHKNDWFDIWGLDNAIDYDIKIYDQWGLLMFESSNPKIDWDGTFKDKDAPPGVYYYILEFGNPCQSNGVDKKYGFLHLLR